MGTTAIRWPDGRIDDRRIEPPHVYIETNDDTPGTRQQAREPAAVLVEAADEIDRWAGRDQGQVSCVHEPRV